MIERVYTRDGGGTVRQAKMGKTYYRLSAGSVVEVREMYFRDLAGTAHPVFRITPRSIVSADGVQLTATTFTFTWTLSGDGAFHTLKVAHVGSGIDVFTLADPVTTSSATVTTSDATEQHVARLYDRDNVLLSSRNFTPSV